MANPGPVGDGVVVAATAGADEAVTGSGDAPVGAEANPVGPNAPTPAGAGDPVEVEGGRPGTVAGADRAGAGRFGVAGADSLRATGEVLGKNPMNMPRLATARTTVR